MADPIDQTTTSPQSLVDAALGTVPENTAPVAPPVLVPLPPLAPPVTPPISTPLTKVAMGDDTPLAFATPNPTVTPTSQTMTPPEQQSSYLPPVPSVPLEHKTKPKSKVGLVLAGVLLMVVALGGGIFGYQRYQMNKQPASINITGDAYEKKMDIQNAKETRNGEYTGVKRLRDDFGLDLDITKPITDPVNAPVFEQFKDETSAQVKEELVAEKTTTTTSGQCLPGDNCPIQCTPEQLGGADGYVPTQEPGGGSFCEGTKQCVRYRREMQSGATHCFVGYGTQCSGDDTCDETKTLDNPSPSPSPSPSASIAPTMACTGLTSVPALTTTPSIGTLLTFTCAGTVTPSSAGTLSYKYRYSINGGAYTAMTNNKLTIAACGDYSVQCQACATLAGVLTCNPTWTGATQ